MRSIREIVRLSSSLKLTANEIHRVTGVSRGTVQGLLRKIKERQLVWPLPEEMDDASLEKLLYGESKRQPQKFQEPDWETIHRELKRAGVNKQLLWEEYICASGQTGYSYSQFCRRYSKWCRQCDIEMRQEHIAGDKLFVDYAGDTMRIIDQETGAVKFAQLFVGVLGASNFCFAEASESQSLRCWIQSHVRMFRAFGGVANCLVPDNLKSGVTKSDRWDPLINESYSRLAVHYDCSIRPARSGKPKDKAKVEKGVQYAETWIMGRLRNMDFFSLADLNEAIRTLVNELNDRPFQKLAGTRRSWFEQLDRPALKKLPTRDFEFEEWELNKTVPKDYHVCVSGHYYSAPYHLRGKSVDIRKTDDTIELLHEGKRVASHARSIIVNGFTTNIEHRPAQHAIYAGLTPEYFLNEASKIGAATTTVIGHILDESKYPQLGFDKCFGLLKSLQKRYGPDQLERACRFALNAGSPAYRIVKAALEQGVDQLPEQVSLPLELTNSHRNVRGSSEYT